MTRLAVDRDKPWDGVQLHYMGSLSPKWDFPSKDFTQRDLGVDCDLEFGLRLLLVAGALVRRPPEMIFSCQSKCLYVYTNISGGKVGQRKNCF